MEQLNYKEDLDLLRRAGFTLTEITRLYQLRRAYVQHELDWAPADLARLRFVRWLVDNGRLSDNLPQSGTSRR
jgi:hypothetical protein